MESDTEQEISHVLMHSLNANVIMVNQPESRRSKVSQVSHMNARDPTS